MSLWLDVLLSFVSIKFAIIFNEQEIFFHSVFEHPVHLYAGPEGSFNLLELVAALLKSDGEHVNSELESQQLSILTDRQLHHVGHIDLWCALGLLLVKTEMTLDQFICLVYLLCTALPR